MSISPFEILAQIFNFLVLMYILNRLLYKPVNETMKRRQAVISQKLDEAERMEAEAGKLIGSYRERMSDIEDERRRIFDKTNEEAREKKEEIVEGFRDEAERKRRSFLDEVEYEKERFGEELRSSLARNSILIAEGILRELSGDELKRMAFMSFLKKISEMELEGSETAGNSEMPVVSAADELDEAQKGEVRAVLAAKLGIELEPSFTVDRTLGEGYSLRLESRLVEVSMRRYLEESGKRIMKSIASGRG